MCSTFVATPIKSNRLMKNKLRLCASACFLLILFLTSCHPGRRAARRKAEAHRSVVTRPSNKVPDTKTLKQKYAEKLGVKPKNIENIPLYSFIDVWYGTKYRLGGNDRSGIDCSAFARKLYDQVYRIDLLRTAVQQFGNCQRIKRTKDAIEGDLVFFKVNSKNVTHVGIYLMNDFFVHASTSGGVMISNLNETYWSKYFEGIGRIPRKG